MSSNPVCHFSAGKKRCLAAFLLGMCLLLSLADAGAAIHYVNIDNTSATHDGQSWSTAFTSIQPAVNAAFTAGGGEVWVAAGTYTAPTNPVVTMKENVQLYGGFSGSETTRDQRNWTDHETVIDGEGARRGLIGANDSALDGFVVTRGNAGLGGGMSCDHLSPNLNNCVFRGNNHCGIYIWQASPNITNCVFTENGTGISMDASSSNVTNCIFTRNTLGYNGGGMDISFSSPRITNCVFAGNASPYVGGGVANWSSSPTIVNCVFSGNSGDEGAGNIYNGDSSSTIINCIFDGEASDFGSGPSVLVVFSCIRGGFPGEGNIDADPGLVDPAAGDFRLLPWSPCIDAGRCDGAPSTDLVGNPRPTGAGCDMGACEYFEIPPDCVDSDFDALPDAAEAEQGCNTSTADATDWITFEYPSHGAVFSSFPVSIRGEILSAYIRGVTLVADNGVKSYFDADISHDSGTCSWGYEWTPPTSGKYVFTARFTNSFKGYGFVGEREIVYQPNSPGACISAPVEGKHVDGVVTVRGTATTGQLGFKSYQLKCVAGTDPGVSTGWTTISSGISEVADGILGTWSVSALPAGPYVLAMTVVDGAEIFMPTTYVNVVVDHDTTPPAAPQVLEIRSVMVDGVVANGQSITLTGIAEPLSTVSYAAIVDPADSHELLRLSNEVTIHKSGSVRGTIPLPAEITCATVALRLVVKDPAGCISPAAMSNPLPVDNNGPEVSIKFPVNNATLPRDLIVVSGTAFDGVDISNVQFSLDNGSWSDAAGTEAWAYEWTPVADGSYTVYVRAYDSLGNVGHSQLSVTVNAAYPSAYITAPAQGLTINEGAVIAVTGTASDGADFLRYKVQYAEGISPSTGWQDITANISSPVVNGTLCNWDTTGLGRGYHTLRLIVLDSSMNSVIFDRLVSVLSRISIDDLPDAELNEGGVLENFIYLPGFTTAISGNPADFTYTITGNTDAGCGVSIDSGKRVDIEPEANWNGMSTVTVTVTNGALSNSDSFKITVNPVNDAPTLPMVSIMPGKPRDTDDLVCTVTAESSDIDGDTVTYTYRWFSSSNPTTAIRTMSGTRSLSDTLPASSTGAGLSYTCAVTPYDGTSNGPHGQATVTVKNDSAISCQASPLSVTLGEPVTLSGEVSSTSGSGALVSFASTAPSGAISGSFPEAIALGGELRSYQRVFYPPEANRGTSRWSVRALWDGDALYRGAESPAVEFDVAKAQPTLMVALDSAAVAITDPNVTVTVSFSAAFPEELTHKFAGKTVKLYMKRPDTSSAGPVDAVTDATGTATFSDGDLGPLNMAGTWQFRAEFSGDDDFLAAFSAAFDEPQAPRLTVKDRAGYAIIAVGKLDAYGEGYAEHAKTADFVYRSLVERGFGHDDIYYFREGAYQPSPDIFVDDTTPTKAEVGTAITEWAPAKMQPTPAPLYVVFVDHGSLETFYLYSGSVDTREVSPAEVDAWFTSLQSALTYPASEENIVLVYGACHAGSFIPQVSGDNRVLMMSCDADEVSHRGVIDPSDGVRYGEAFVVEFFRDARAGKTLKTAFESAAVTVGDYTATHSNGSDGRAQNPMLDDNADGAGTSGMLSFEPGAVDGALAHSLVLGYGVNAGPPVSWLSVSPMRVLGPTDPVGTLEAWCDARPSTGHTAWVEVMTPDYAGGVPADMDFEDSQYVVNLTRFEPTGGNDSEGRFIWSGYGSLFDSAGTYKVFYYIQDSETGEVSSHMLTTVYRSTTGNGAPAAVNAIFPDEGAYMMTTAFFAWEASVDPDGDAVTYRLEVSESSDFPEAGLVVRENLTARVIQLTPADGLQDLRDYYWRVIPIDEYGASPINNPVHTFNTDNVNPSFPSGLTGTVTDLDTGDPVSGASISLTPGTWSTVSSSDGLYFINLSASGSYSLTVTAPGYLTVTAPVTVQAGLNEKSVGLQLLSAVAPVITSHPLSATVEEGESVTFTVSANGMAPLSYQWKKDDADISGAISASYTISSVEAADAGAYTCTVTNIAGYANSNTAVLVVNAGEEGEGEEGEGEEEDNPPAGGCFKAAAIQGRG